MHTVLETLAKRSTFCDRVRWVATSAGTAQPINHSLPRMGLFCHYRTGPPKRTPCRRVAKPPGSGDQRQPRPHYIGTMARQLIEVEGEQMDKRNQLFCKAARQLMKFDSDIMDTLLEIQACPLSQQTRFANGQIGGHST